MRKTTPSTAVLGDTTYTLSPPMPDDFTAAREYLKNKTPNPLERLTEIKDMGLDVEVQKVLATEIYDDYRRWGSLSTADGKQWAASLEGIAFFFWRFALAAHPELNNDEGRLKIFHDFRTLTADELRRQMNRMDEFVEDPEDPETDLGALKNSSRDGVTSSPRPARRPKNKGKGKNRRKTRR